MTTHRTIHTMPRPFLKWAGGKRQLLPRIWEQLPRTWNHYYEPFIGGGACFFALAAAQRLPDGATLGDINAEIITCYQVIRDHVDAVISALEAHAVHAADPAYFYAVRAWDTEPTYLQRDPVMRAARTMFLNRTCFNGLYRQNQRGHFNVPFGKYVRPTICDRAALYAAHRALHGISLRAGDFATTLADAGPADLVYLDPPYIPRAHASFTRYAAPDFGLADHERLAACVESLLERGCHVVISNSDTPTTRRIYCHPSARVIELQATRAINRNGAGRTSVGELLICATPQAA